jgi:hypothetical protein
MRTSFLCIDKSFKCEQNGNGKISVEVTLVPTGKDPVKGGTVHLVADESTLAGIKPGAVYSINIKEEA